MGGGGGGGLGVVVTYVVTKIVQTGQGLYNSFVNFFSRAPESASEIVEEAEPVVVDTIETACGDDVCENEVRAASNATQEVLQLSKHALQRMAQRGVSLEQVQSTVNNGKSFQYFHNGVWKTGYYDPLAKIFVGEAQGTITTVITNVKPRYIENLQKVTP